MDNKLYRAMTLLLWLALPLTGLQYGLVWDQLPARMATHFGASGQANGWMSRQASMIFPPSPGCSLESVSPTCLPGRCSPCSMW
jgi:hypothetical protein